MATEKPWYTGIKNARGEGTDSKDIADWFREADTDLNPYSYREVPKDMVAFYLYLLQSLKDANTPPILLKSLDLCIKSILKQGNTEKYKIFYSLALVIDTYKQRCEDFNNAPILSTTKILPKCSTTTIVPKLSDYLPFITNAVDKLGNIIQYLNTIQFDTILSNFIENTENPLKNEYLKELYTLFIVNISTIKVDTTNPTTTAKLREEYLVKILLFLIETEPDQYYKSILENLPAYADMFPTNYSGDRILSRKLLETFKNYISNFDDIDKKERLYIFLSKLLELKDNRSVTNETLLYDAFNFIPDEELGGRIFPTYLFRYDFNRNRGVANEFTDEELEAIDSCFAAQQTNFSTFMNILNTNNTKQGAIDSLLIAMPSCKDILSKASILQTEEKQLELKNTSEDEETEQNKKIFEAIQKGDKREVAQLLSAGVDINYMMQNETKKTLTYTPLMYAILQKKIEIANFLIRNYANVDIQNSEGDTALIYAAYDGNLVVVQNLLLQPANVKIKNDKGISALDAAKNSSSPNKAAIINLLEAAELPGGLDAVQEAIESQASAVSQQAIAPGLPKIGTPVGPGKVSIGTEGNNGGAAYLIYAQYPKDLDLEERKVIALEQMAKIKEKKYLLSLMLLGAETTTTLTSTMSSSTTQKK